MMYEIEKMPSIIDIGYTGEIDFRTVQIDMTAWVEKVPAASPILMYVKPGEHEPYPVEITYEDNIITWSVTDEDLGTREGTGLLQVWFGVRDEDQVLRKMGMSAVVATMVHLSLAGEGHNTSTVQIPWLTEITEIKNAVLGYDYEAEAWAVGQRGGEDVSSDDPAYENNSKYFAEQAEAAKTVAVEAKEAAEAILPTTITEWLETNITSPEYPLDRTLSLSTAATPADMTGDLKSAFDSLTDIVGLGTDITSQITLTNGAAIYYDDGKTHNGQAPSYSNYVPIPDGIKKMYVMMVVQNDSTHRGLAFYTSNSQSSVISGGVPCRKDTSLSAWAAELVEVTIPSTAKYFRTTWFATTHQEYSNYTFKCYLVNPKSHTEQINEIRADVEENTTDIDMLKVFVQKEGCKETAEGTYIILNECSDLPIAKITSASNASLTIKTRNIFIPGKPGDDDGITTVKQLNADGSVAYISLSGTTPADDAYLKSMGSILMKAGVDYYIYTGDDISANHRLVLSTANAGGTKTYINYNGQKYTPVTDQTMYLNVAVSKNTTVSDWRIYPMITVGEPLFEYEPGYQKTFSITSGEMDMDDLNYLTLFKGYNLVHAVASDAYITIGIEYFKDIPTIIDNHEERIETLEETVDDLINSSENSVTWALSRQFRYLYRKHIPDYFLDDDNSMYLHGKISAFNALTSDDKFTFWTDSHWLWSAKNTMPIIGYVNSWCEIGKTIYGGDILGNGCNTTKAQAQYLLAQHQDEVRDVFGRDWYYVFGNHDINQSGGVPSGMTTEEFEARALSFAEVYANCIKPYEDDGQVFPETNPLYPKGTEFYYWNRLRYYFDNENSKIRYIVLNSGTPHNPLYNSGIIGQSNYNELYLQLGWLYDVLMGCPDDYSVVVVTHEFSTVLPDMDTPAKSVAKMLVAMKNKASCTVQSGRAETTTTTFNFENAKADVVMMLCGHSHTDTCMVCTGYDGSATYEAGTTASSNSVLCVFTTCDTRHNKEEQMTLGTTNELAFDLFSIDKTNRKINTVRIGYGNNREFTY